MIKNLLLTGIVTISCIICGHAQNVPANVPTDGLIGYWPFNGNANDESGNSNNGTNMGATLTTNRFGQADSAYLFDGSTTYISVPNSASLQSPSTGLTMQAWIYLNGVSISGQPFSPVITKTNSTNNGFMYRMDVDVNNTGFYAGINNWTTNLGTTYAFNLHQWYMITAVMDSFSTYLYLNDTLLNTIEFTGAIDVNTLPLEFGRDEPGDMEIFNGKIDDIAIWNKALTIQQVSTLYNGLTTGIHETIADSPISIYPNPATSQVNIRASSNAIGEAYTIYNQLGQTVLSGRLNSVNTTISTSNLSSGVYILSTGNDASRWKFCVGKE